MPWVVGSGVAIEGRSIPLIIFRNILAATVAAPVLPADSTPSQSPLLTSFVATTRLASFLWRMASTGCSPISMASLA